MLNDVTQRNFEDRFQLVQSKAKQKDFAEIELFWEIDSYCIPIYVNGKVVEWIEKYILYLKIVHV